MIEPTKEELIAYCRGTLDPVVRAKVEGHTRMRRNLRVLLQSKAIAAYSRKITEASETFSTQA